MKLVECSGSPRELGRQTGEALREDIAANIEIFTSGNRADWEKRLPIFLDVLKTCLPNVLDEMDGMAEGAGRTPQEIYMLNIPSWNNDIDLVDGCTNVVFIKGEDGPVLGKNNDGCHPVPPRNNCVRYVRPTHGIPQVVFGFSGWISTCDGMNAEGLAVGHSSVGSIFQQSDHFPCIRLWEYDARFRCRTTAEFIQRMTTVPLRGKGYSIVCVDQSGSAVSLEAACPIIQVRRPDRPTGIHCVNCYQLPQLANADQRRPADKEDALSRKAHLDNILDGDGPFNTEHMKNLLRNHVGQAICRHGSKQDDHNTEYSMIALPTQNKVLYLEGNPCEQEYTELLM